MYLMCFNSLDISLSNGENRSSLSSSYQKLFKLQWSAFYFETDSSILGLSPPFLPDDPHRIWHHWMQKLILHLTQPLSDITQV